MRLTFITFEKERKGISHSHLLGSHLCDNRLLTMNCETKTPHRLQSITREVENVGGFFRDLLFNQKHFMLNFSDFRNATADFGITGLRRHYKTDVQDCTGGHFREVCHVNNTQIKNQISFNYRNFLKQYRGYLHSHLDYSKQLQVDNW